MSDRTVIENPAGLPAPLGLYSHVASVPAGHRTIYVAGQLPVAPDGESVGAGDVAVQLRQVMANLAGVLESQGLSLDHVVKFTTYLTSADHIPGFMAARNALWPTMFTTTAYPPNTLLIVDRLVHPEFDVEIEAIAAGPAREG